MLQSSAAENIEPHHLHVPQADMLVADSKPKSVPYSSSKQPATVKNVAAGNWSEPLEWIWQVILVDS